ncbi:MAG: hypothetical protein P4L76_08650 [Beijerinckiaceae bacterium]|nr:hypothetical protein [Beijerinckiaceae bacterium]
MSTTWNTKYGTRRVRHDPPTLSEAIAAAQDLTDDPAAQVEIAAGLIGVPVDEVKLEMQKLAPDRRLTRTVTITAPARDKDHAPRTVIVERKSSRRVIARTKI